MRMKKPLIAAAVISGAFGLGFGGAAVASAATTPSQANTTSVSTTMQSKALDVVRNDRLDRKHREFVLFVDEFVEFDSQMPKHGLIYELNVELTTERASSRTSGPAPAIDA